MNPGSQIIGCTVFALFLVIGFWGSLEIVYGDLVSKYRALDPLVQNVLSVESWWLETLVGGCIPMFIAFGIRFYLLKIDPKTKDIIFAVLPFIPKLNWLAGKPVYFMLGTGSALLGAVLFLGIKGDAKYLWALFLPAAMLCLSYIAHRSYKQIMEGSEFGELTKKFHTRVGGACMLLAVICWIYADLYSPLNDLCQLLSELRS